MALVPWVRWAILQSPPEGHSFSLWGFKTVQTPVSPQTSGCCFQTDGGYVQQVPLRPWRGHVWGPHVSVRERDVLCGGERSPPPVPHARCRSGCAPGLRLRISGPRPSTVAARHPPGRLPCPPACPTVQGPRPPSLPHEAPRLIWGVHVKATAVAPLRRPSR